MKRYFILLTIAVMLFASCRTSKSSRGSDFLASNMDTSFKPGDDFFLFANNGWFKNHPIPPSEQSNGLWQLILDTINAQVHRICENAALSKNEVRGSNKQKIGDLYFSGMDSVGLNRRGISDLQPELNQINAIIDRNSLAKAVAMVHLVSGSPLFGFHVGQDDKMSSKYAVFIGQGGISLPDRNYYFDTDARAVEIRKKFSGFCTDMFIILGYDSIKAKIAADKFIQLETALAGASRKKEDTRDPLKNYNKMAAQQLFSAYPNFDWKTFMASSEIQPDTVIIGQPEFLTQMDGYLKTYSLDDWKNYLKFHLLRGLAPYLDDQTFKIHFDFYYTTIRGIPEAKPRWKRVTDQTNRSLGELIGQVYVEEYLPKGTKEKLQEIGNSIRDVYAVRIQQLDWMSATTKEKAMIKLKGMVMKVGYPDKWKDMSSLHTDRNSYVRNIMNANLWESKDMLNKYGKPVDRNEWDMYPQTYNAYYNPSNNEIVVPGCNIIVPGYEKQMADDAILYSIIGGSTFGHEITHGFDDQGSKYDEKGNLNNWWTPEDSAKFYAKTGKIVDQFNQYIAVDSLPINGELTQGENIADLGGVIMGYEAFKKTKQFKHREKIAGLTPDQRFFLGYALAWMINERPESIANQIKTDEHSPAKFRVLGPLSNMKEFYEIYQLQPHQKMYRNEESRVQIW